MGALAGVDVVRVRFDRAGRVEAAAASREDRRPRLGRCGVGTRDRIRPRRWLDSDGLCSWFLLALVAGHFWPVVGILRPVGRRLVQVPFGQVHGADPAARRRAHTAACRRASSGRKSCAGPWTRLAPARRRRRGLPGRRRPSCTDSRDGPGGTTLAHGPPTCRQPRRARYTNALEVAHSVGLLTVNTVSHVRASLSMGLGGLLGPVGASRDLLRETGRPAPTGVPAAGGRTPPSAQCVSHWLRLAPTAAMTRRGAAPEPRRARQAPGS